MKRSPMPRRRSPLRKRSGRREAYEAELAALRPLVLARSGGRCEYRDEEGRCISTACVIHHAWRRSQGGPNRMSLGPMQQLWHLCDPHHRWIHNHPEQSYATGHLIRPAHGRALLAAEKEAS